jgi:uncharacterized protein (DUF2141 family)
MLRQNSQIASILIPLLIGGLGTLEAHAADASLDLTIERIAPIEGQIAVAIFATAEAYKSGKDSIASEMVSVDGETVTVSFSGLESGACAIKIFHDVNGNGELDTNLLGFPTEPFGFSNEAKARFGPPSFDEARFDLEDGANEHVIRLDSAEG